MAGLLSVPAARGGVWGGRGREGRTGRQGRTRGGGRAKEERGNDGGAGEGVWRPSARNPGRSATARGWGFALAGKGPVPGLLSPADQRGPARGACGCGTVLLGYSRFRAAFPGSSRVPPGVWPCACTCALARSRGRRLHGCCVDRPAVLDAGGWGIAPPHSPQAAEPVRGARPASRTVNSRGSGAFDGQGAGVRRGGAAGRGSPARNALNAGERVKGSLAQRFLPGPRLAGCRRSDAVGPGDARTSVRPRPSGAGIGRNRAVHARRYRGTQRPEFTVPLARRATRAGRARAAGPGVRPAAFARGACAHDVRRP